MAALAAGGGVLVSGPAGIGKSALLDAIGSACSAAGQLVLRCASAAAESLAAVPGPVRPVLRRRGLPAGGGSLPPAPGLRRCVDAHGPGRRGHRPAGHPRRGGRGAAGAVGRASGAADPGRRELPGLGHGRGAGLRRPPPPGQPGSRAGRRAALGGAGDPRGGDCCRRTRSRSRSAICPAQWSPNCCGRGWACGPTDKLLATDPRRRGGNPFYALELGRAALRSGTRGPARRRVAGSRAPARPARRPPARAAQGRPRRAPADIHGRPAAARTADRPRMGAVAGAGLGHHRVRPGPGAALRAPAPARDRVCGR